MIGDTTTERLDEVFELVKPKPNWKYPIRAKVHCEQATVEEIVDAVIYFCGGVPEVWAEGAFWRVEGSGYYEWIGA